jgi:carboxypeptidase Q
MFRFHAQRIAWLLPSIALVAAPGAPARLRAEPAPAWVEQYRAPAARLIAEATADHFAWRRLALLTDSFGHRLSGSTGLERAIAWAVEELKRDGLENVHIEPVMVPKWVRGHESAEIVEPNSQPIAMLGLGDSIGTPHDGIEAEVIVVRSFDDLDAKSMLVKGKIVVFNIPFANNYTEARAFRMTGPSRAARYGAVAALVRSIGPAGQRLPHTGGLQYAPGVPQIPAAAVATEDADRLQRMADRGTRVVVRLRMALRIMKKLGLRPRRTVRLVLWTNEENGTRGALAYRDAHRHELDRHVMMLESDTGVFRPTGFGFTGPERARSVVIDIARELLSGIAPEVTPDGEGADISPSVRNGRIPALALNVAGNYFAIHHTEADTVDKIDPGEMAKCAAAITVMAYVIADLPRRLTE